MKILLLQPIIPKHILWGKYEKGGGFVPPIGLISIAAYLREAGHDVEVKDTQLEKMGEEELTNYLKGKKFEAICMPTFTPSVAFVYATAKICKKALPGVKMIFGGVHVTILPERTLLECPDVDYLILGEGEYRIEALLKYFEGKILNLSEIDGIAYRQNNKIVVQKAASLIENLDALPLPAYDLLDMKKYVPHPTQYKVLPNYPLVIQRGCPYNCTFCSANIIHGRKLRFKSVGRVMKELHILKDRFGAKGVYFQDSTFLANKAYIKELLNRMIEEKLNLIWACNTRVNTVDEEILRLMKKAGCWMIAYGIESGNQKSLDLIKKGVTVEQNEKAVRMTEAAGIVPFCCYILCLPNETYEDALNTIDFALKLKSPAAMFYLPVPYPGTELMETCVKDGGLRKDAKWEDYSSFDDKNPVYINPLIGKEKMRELASLAYRRYYTNPIIIIKNILLIRSYIDIKKYLAAFRAVFNI